MASESLRLRIVFDGTAPGLIEHRLSIAAFADPLKLLLQAYRRIASGLIRDMLDTPDYGRAGGRYAEEAKGIDLEIFELVGNSPLQIGFECRAHVPVTGQLSLFAPDFLKRVGKLFLENIEGESKGELRNAAVRRYLLSLPSGISRQSYKFEQDQTEIGTVVIGNMDIAQLPEQLPRLEKIEGDVIGVGFAPGPPEVRIKPKNDNVIVLTANEKQVVMALSFRGSAVTAMTLVGKTKKLLWIRSQNAPQTHYSYEQVVNHIDERWGKVLKRLAE